MNRYQPAEQVNNGVQTYRIVDVRHNMILSDVWHLEANRDKAMDYLNSLSIPMTPEQAAQWRSALGIRGGDVREVLAAWERND